MTGVRLRTITVTRYVTPLREGGSLPAVVEADDDGMYVLKFRGAGQGPKVLIAELVCGEIARTLGLPVPEIVFAELDGDLARTEPDHEISALIRHSAGLNLAVDYLPGSCMFDPLVFKVDPDLASRIVWFDAYVTNVDRTPRNPNMLTWHKRLWVIDHGASLYFHHSPDWPSVGARTHDPFVLVRQHALLRPATRLEAVDAELSARLSRETLRAIVDLVPDEWLTAGDAGQDPAHLRESYAAYLAERLTAPRAFVEEARRAR